MPCAQTSVIYADRSFNIVIIIVNYIICRLKMYVCISVIIIIIIVASELLWRSLTDDDDDCVFRLHFRFKLGTHTHTHT